MYFASRWHGRTARIWQKSCTAFASSSSRKTSGCGFWVTDFDRHQEVNFDPDRLRPSLTGRSVTGEVGGEVMNKFLSGLILSVVVAAPAAAADLPVRAAPVYTPPPGPVGVFTWTGCFIGGNAGGHFGRDNITSTTNPIPSGASA